jgi:transposase
MGCVPAAPWRYLSTDLSRRQTVYCYFLQWEQAGVTDALVLELRIKDRHQAGREDEPSGGIIDFRSVKGADTVGCGYDAGKKINGRKRFLVTDTTGLLVTVAVMAARCKDRDGGKTAQLPAYLTTPNRHVFADRGASGRLVDWARDMSRTTLEIVRKPAGVVSASSHAKWVTTPCRHLGRDYERDPAVTEAIIRWAAIAGMTFPPHRSGHAQRQPRYICD